MSVCVSSSLSGIGMSLSSLSHLPSLASTMSSMGMIQPHQMASSSPHLTTNLPTLDLPHTHGAPIQLPQPLPNASTDPNDPNPEMLLALIARNRSLEGMFVKKKIITMLYETPSESGTK